MKDVSMKSTISDIQLYVENQIPEIAKTKKLLAGSIGESPSKYSRSPGMWNAVFDGLDFDAAYVPFDVRPENLSNFINALKNYPGFMGANVTVPYKLAIMDLLDSIDSTARQIGAVNTFALNSDMTMTGFNTDADGLIASMLLRLPGEVEPFIPTLEGKNVLLLGAGGAGRAAAFAIAKNIKGGALLMTNRSLQRVEDLVSEVNLTAENGTRIVAIGQNMIGQNVHDVDLIVNASTVGQSGIRSLPDNFLTSLEPFSSLAPANPPEVPDPGDSALFWQQWFSLSYPEITSNNHESMEAISSTKSTAAFVDAIYSPSETVLLRQARLSGRKTLNGRGMLIMQAASSFVNRMTRRHLENAGYNPDSLYDFVVETMSDAF